MRFTEAVESFNQNSSVKLQTVGGDPGLGSSNYPSRSDDWAKSVINHLALADFGDGGLHGLWTLASSQARQARLHYA